MGDLAVNLQLAAIHEVNSADADQGRAVRAAFATEAPAAPAWATGPTATRRIGELQDMLSARDGKAGFRRNTQAIRAEIARLQHEA